MGSWLRQLREELALTQVQLSEVLGINHMTVSRWENGRGAPAAYQVALWSRLRRENVQDIYITRGPVEAFIWLLRERSK
jgi:transcriptional regulator with XRE-family HTH domain